MSTLDPFDSIDPLVKSSVENNAGEVPTSEMIDFFINKKENFLEDDDNDEWEMGGEVRNTFDLFNVESDGE